MSVTRRLVLSTSLLFATAFPVLAGDAPYLGPDRLDLRLFLAPPPPAGGAEDLADLRAVIDAQTKASPERIAQAVEDVEETVYVLFGKQMGSGFTPEKLPLATRFFERLGAAEDATVDPAKPFFGRVRPYLASPEVKALVKASKSGSWPSGHTTRVTLEGIVLAAIVPEKRVEIWDRVADYAQSRVIGGMHYPSDLVAGRAAGTAMAATLFADPAFLSDLAAVKVEVRTALGL